MNIQSLSLDDKLQQVGAGYLDIDECRAIARQIIIDEPTDEGKADLYAALRDLTGRVLRTAEINPDYVGRLCNLLRAIAANMGKPWSYRIAPLSELLYEHQDMIMDKSRHMGMARIPI